MRTFPWFGLSAIILAALIIPFAVAGWHTSQRHAEFRRRYAAIAPAVPLHRRRVDVEQDLKQMGIKFGRGVGPGSVAMDDVVQLCDIPPASPLCSGEEQPMAVIRFAETAEGRQRRTSSGQIGLVNPVYPISDAADDEVAGISYDVTSSGDS